MNNGVHFISGLPRSGSTLLCALLRQNPALHAGISSPVASMFGAILREVSQGSEGAVFIDDAQRQALLRGVFDGYYHDIHPRQTVFDTSRGWTARAPLLASLFPQAKIICCVRHIPWIIDSIEQLLGRNRWELSKIFDFDPTGTVYSRADGLMRPNGMIGYPLNGLKQAMHGAAAERLLLISYDSLAREPDAVLAKIYEFCELPPFAHDVGHVSFDAAEFDARLGTPGLHRVTGAVQPRERRSMLPPDLWRRYEGDSIWRDPAFNTGRVRIL